MIPVTVANVLVFLLQIGCLLGYHIARIIVPPLRLSGIRIIYCHPSAVVVVGYCCCVTLRIRYCYQLIEYIIRIPCGDGLQAQAPFPLAHSLFPRLGDSSLYQSLPASFRTLLLTMSPALSLSMCRTQNQDDALCAGECCYDVFNITMLLTMPITYFYYILKMKHNINFSLHLCLDLILTSNFDYLIFILLSLLI